MQLAHKYRKIWRIAIPILLLFALMGPWTIEQIFLPPQFSCSYPYVRLEGDFCGTTGYKGIVILPSAFISIFIDLVTRATSLTDRVDLVLLQMLLPFLLVLPFVSTFLLILRGDRRSRQLFSIVTWGLAAGACFLLVFQPGLSDSLKYFRLIWGLWFFFALVIIALVLEVLTLISERRLNSGG
jgi:hypothetical protein